MVAGKHLHSVISAALIGKGEWIIKNGQHYIEFSLAPVQREFFKKYININELQKWIAFITEKNITRIHIPEELTALHNLWYKDHIKIPNALCMDPHAILLSILLFSERRHNSLELKANFERKYLANIAYFIEMKINIPVEPRLSAIRIYDITALFLFAIKYLSIYELNLFLSYLEKSERENLVFHFQNYKEKYKMGAL